MEAAGALGRFNVPSGRGMPPQEVARRASRALQFRGGEFFEFKACEVCRQMQPLL